MTTTADLDFPPIEVAAPSAQNPVALAAGQALDFAKLDLADIALARFGDWRSQVDAARRKFAGLALDLSTPTKVSDAKTLRQAVINAPRAAARALSKDMRSKLAQVGKVVAAAEEQIVEAWDDAEKLITPQIEAADARIEAERQERQRQAAEAARLESERKQRHEAGIAKLSGYVAMARGKSAAEIAKGLVYVRGLAIDPAQWEEFAEAAAAALDSTIAKLEEMHATAAKAEAEAAELAALRAEKAARDEEDALVASINAAAARVEQETVAYIQKAITAFDPIAADWAGDPRQRVAQAVSSGRAQLSLRLSAAQTREREAEECAQREAKAREDAERPALNTADQPQIAANPVSVEPAANPAATALTTCAGSNCSSADGSNHSAECQAQHDATIDSAASADNTVANIRIDLGGLDDGPAPASSVPAADTAPGDVPCHSVADINATFGAGLTMTRAYIETELHVEPAGFSDRKHPLWSERQRIEIAAALRDRAAKVAAGDL